MDPETPDDGTSVGVEETLVVEEPDERSFFDTDDSIEEPPLSAMAGILDDDCPGWEVDCIRESPCPEADPACREAVAEELGGSSCASVKSGMTLAKNCPLSSWNRTNVLPWPRLPVNSALSPNPLFFIRFRPEPRDEPDALP